MSCDQPDREAVRLHVELIHQLAETFAGQGKLVVASYDENPTTGEALIPKVEHFEVGATEAMTAAIVRLSREQHRNVYVPLAVVRKSLARGKKGEEADVIGVLGTVGDFDDDDADQYEQRLPLPPCYALESSADRYQTFNLYDRPAAVAQAKPVAVRLKAFAKCDHGTVDMSHVWRVPGTLNWPNAKKAKAGRPLDPQLVKVARPWNGARTSLAELAAVLPETEQSDETAEPNPGADISVELLVRQLPPKLRKRGDRSKTLFSVVKELDARGFDPTMIARVIQAYPNGIGAKHASRNDLDKDIARILAKPSPNRDSWQNELIQGDGNTPRSNVANTIIALRCAPEWQGVLGYDIFGEKVVIRAKAPWMTSPPPRPIAWNDIDEIRLADWLQHQYIFVTPRTAGQAVSVVAHDSEFHPVRDYLASLIWDGTPRLDDWLVRYLGVHSENPPEDDDELEQWKKVHRYVENVGPKFMIACIARVEEPGCQADYALILEGPQGQRKSTAIRALVPNSNWFTDEISDLGTKDAALQLAGRWLIEWSELDSMSRADISRVKAYMSRTTDKFRPPYGREVIERPRQCGFIGTVNKDEYLRDETGGRRFWPVKCGTIDIEALRCDRDQLWAEARYRYFEKESRWLDDAEDETHAAAEQAARRVRDPWEPRIAEYIAPKDYATVRDVLGAALFVKTEHQDRLAANRVAACFRALEWERFRAGKDYEDDLKRGGWGYRPAGRAK